MSHDRGCPCGRERYEYDECKEPACYQKPRYVEPPKTSKVSELEDYLKSKGVVSFHVDVVEGADPELVAAEVLAAMRERDSIPNIEIPQDQLEDLYDRFRKLLTLCRFSVEEWMSMEPTERELRHKIFEQADFGALIAGQYLPKESRKKIIKANVEETT